MSRRGNSCAVRDVAAGWGSGLGRGAAATWKRISGDFGADVAEVHHVVTNALHSLPGFRKIPENN